MSEFKVYGPFRIKATKRAAARVLSYESFWDSDKRLDELSSRTGVYVFAIKPPRASTFTPYYVGKATKGFAQEVFTSDKLVKYYNVLSQFRSGYPVLFFLVAPMNAGPVNKRAISAVEKHFTKLGKLVNPNIENVHGIKLPNWSVGGLIRSSTRKASRSAKEFAAMFELGASQRTA